MIRLRVGPFPLAVHASFFLFVALIGWSARMSVSELVVWTAVVGVSILVHELGHAMAVRRFGGDASITIYSLGGYTQWQRSASTTPWQSLFISFAGSAAGLAVGTTIWMIGRTGLLTGLTGLPRFALVNAIFINIVWGLVNWIPIRNLDGGHMVMHVLEGLRVRRAARIAEAVYWVTAAGVVVYAVASGRLIIAFLAIFFTLRSGTVGARDAAVDERVEAMAEALQKNDPAEVLRLATDVREDGPDTRTLGLVADLELGALLQMGRAEAAVGVLERLPKDVPVRPSTAGAVYVAAGRPRQALGHLGEALRSGEATTWSRQMVALALAGLGRVDEAIGYVLETEPGELEPGLVAHLVRQIGPRHPTEARRVVDHLLTRPDLDPVVAAECEVWAGRPDAASGWLEQAPADDRRADDVRVILQAATGNATQALRALERRRSDGSAARTAASVQVLAIDSGDADAALAAGTLIRALTREPEMLAMSSYNEACAHAALGNPRQGLAALSEAVDAGFRDVSMVDTDPDLDPLRAHEEFGEIRRRLAGVEQSDHDRPLH